MPICTVKSLAYRGSIKIFCENVTDLKYRQTSIFFLSVGHLVKMNCVLPSINCQWHCHSSVSLIFPGISSRVRNTSRGRRPGGIQYRCPNVSWLLLEWRSSRSTLSSFRVTTELLKSAPPTLRRKLILAGYRQMLTMEEACDWSQL